jgi:hypothetical protein
VHDVAIVDTLVRASGGALAYRVRQERQIHLDVGVRTFLAARSAGCELARHGSSPRSSRLGGGSADHPPIDQDATEREVDVGAEQVAMSGVAAIGRRPWLSNALFRLTKWGNPFVDERFSWPYPMYDRMRADGPVSYGRPYRQWFDFGYDEVQEVLRSPHTATAPIGQLLLSTSRYRRLSPSARSSFSTWLLVNDAPDHTRLRSAASRAFTPRQIER